MDLGWTCLLRINSVFFALQIGTNAHGMSFNWGKDFGRQCNSKIEKYNAFEVGCSV